PPLAQDFEANFIRRIDRSSSGRVAESATRPVHGTILGANAKSHERRAVVEVESTPVPARRVARQIFARPFVIEPRAAFDRLAFALHAHSPAHRKMRPAVVVARLDGSRTFARHALLPLQQ